MDTVESLQKKVAAMRALRDAADLLALIREVIIKPDITGYGWRYLLYSLADQTAILENYLSEVYYNGTNPTQHQQPLPLEPGTPDDREKDTRQG